MKNVSKKCKVIKTDSKETTSICLMPNGKLSYEDISRPPLHGIRHMGWKFQNLYLISDNEIFENEYILLHENNNFIVGKVIEIYNDTIEFKYNNATVEKKLIKNCYKIIATTNSNLNLISIPNAFIEEFCKKNGNINHVMVDFTLHTDQHPDWRPTYYNPDDPPTISFLIPKMKGNDIVISHII